MVYSIVAESSANDLNQTHPPAIKNFLEEEEVIALLANPYHTPQPSPQSKNAFDTKTSAINITPSANAQYNITEIKEDALWLSKATNTEELAALRLVVEEYQSRATSQLLGPFSEGELASIRDAAGSSKYSSSIPTPLTLRGRDAEDIRKDFATQQSRRRRIFRLYISERQYLLKCTEWILGVLFDTLLDGNTYVPNDPNFGPAWLTACLNAFRLKLVSNENQLLLRYISGIEKNMENIGKGSSFEEEGRRDDPEQWFRSQITEAIHSMELMWQVFHYTSALASSEVVLRWFRLLRDLEFFSTFLTVGSNPPFLPLHA